MNLEVHRVGTVDVVTPQGPLVDDDAEALARAVQAKLHAANPRLVVALQEVAYFDSRGIEALVEATVELQQRGGRLRLAGVTPACREVLEITGQSARFEFFEDTENAVRSFL